MNNLKKYHFIAIGGAVMHNLALELSALGNEITGSDDEIFDPAKTRLGNAGLLPEKFGWFPEKITKEIDGIILGMHAREDNPELVKARELGLEIYSFPDFIYEHSKNKKRIVIAGSHGKTTSTAMLMHVLRKKGIDFDYLVGSQLEGFERMVRLSNAPVMVIEGDEYLTSPIDRVPKFLKYHPHLAMITGIAWDHINVFPTMDDYVEQFEQFIDTIKSDGLLVWFKGDEILEKLSAKAPCRQLSYECPEYLIEQGVTFVKSRGGAHGLEIFGKHNLENAAGISVLASELGINSEDFWTAMESFSGTAKRLERVYDSENLTIFRDFAHAPSKVSASVKAVRENYPDRTFIAVFELHTFSSLSEDFLPGYKHTLDPADKAFVLFDPHVYMLKKMPVPSAEKLEKTIGNVNAISDPLLLKTEIDQLLNTTHPVVLLFMSSGNLGGIDVNAFAPYK